MSNLALSQTGFRRSGLTRRPPASVYLMASSHEGYFLPEPLTAGYNGTVFFKQLNPSAPAFKMVPLKPSALIQIPR